MIYTYRLTIDPERKMAVADRRDRLNRVSLLLLSIFFKEHS